MKQVFYRRQLACFCNSIGHDTPQNTAKQLFHRREWTFFCTISHRFGYFWGAILGPFLGFNLKFFLGLFLGHNGVVLGSFRTVLFFWVDLGHFWVTLRSLWHRFDVVLTLFWRDLCVLFWPFSCYLLVFLIFHFGCVVFFFKNIQSNTKRCKHMQFAVFLSKFTRIVGKPCSFVLLIQLFHLKNTQIWRFNLWKCAVCECVWKYLEWILSVFMHFCEGIDDFWAFFSHYFQHFQLFLGHFGFIWAHTSTCATSSAFFLWRCSFCTLQFIVESRLTPALLHNILDYSLHTVLWGMGYGEC